MKYLNKTILLILFLLLYQRCLFAKISGSAHDFSGPSFSHAAEGEICKVCHIPHNAGSTEVPLWRSNIETKTYILYDSATLDAKVSQPLAPTKACLTCHDGSISANKSFDCIDCHSMHDTNIPLNDDHPVSFTFDKSLAYTDGELNDPEATTVSILGKTIQRGMLYQDRMECPSCHDVHATKGDSAIPGGHLLLVENKADKLCLICHVK